MRGCLCWPPPFIPLSPFIHIHVWLSFLLLLFHLSTQKSGVCSIDSFARKELISPSRQGQAQGASFQLCTQCCHTLGQISARLNENHKIASDRNQVSSAAVLAAGSGSRIVSFLPLIVFFCLFFSYSSLPLQMIEALKVYADQLHQENNQSGLNNNTVGLWIDLVGTIMTNS